RKVRNTVFGVLSYENKVIPDPNMIPISKAMKMVPDPAPRRLISDKSPIQAINVGLFIPVAIPKMVAAMINVVSVVANPVNSIEKINKDIPIINVFLLPILSDKDPVNNRTTIVEIA